MWQSQALKICGNCVLNNVEYKKKLKEGLQKCNEKILSRRA